MSLVLSIYSQKGFREVTLPERGQNIVEILLQKELFGLESDINLIFEKKEQGWSLEVPNARLSESKIGTAQGSVLISDGQKLDVEAYDGGRVTLICFEQEDPFCAYHKYSLSEVNQIAVGREADNDIRYENGFVGRHHCVITFENGKAVLHDESKNGTYLNYRRVYGSTVLKYGDSIRIMRLNIIFLGNMLAVDSCDNLTVSLRELEAEEIGKMAADPVTGGAKKILFHRSPRNLRKLITEPVEIEAPPTPPEKQDIPLAMVIGPAMTMSIPMLLSAGFSIWASRSGGSYSGTFMYMGIVTAVASAIIAVIWALVNVRFTARQRRQAENRRFESYSEYLLHMKDKLEQASRKNAEALNERYLSAERCCQLNEESPLLWNRNIFHEDFLSIRLGIGEVPFQAPIVIPKERFTMINDSLADKPQLLQDNFSILHDVPVTVDLKKNRLVGIAGGESRRNAMSIAKAMIAQIAASNCYTDVKLAVVYDERNDIDRGSWDFALWLPHVWSADKKIRYIATNRSEMGDVFHALTQTLRMRSEDESKGDAVYKPYFILFIADPKLLDGEAISHYIFDRDGNLGMSAILLAERFEDLPNDCECIIRCDEAFSGIYNTREGVESGTSIAFDSVSDEEMDRFARTLGRIEVVESEADGEIPNSLTFFDMFSVNSPEELNAAERWRHSDVTASMKALIGFRNGNNPCYLDIHERYHGPHGLVAGTTGSGKSETLQTYILSLAVNYSPEDVGFFIIDYKGGGMANLFDGLPHMIGSISNLSGNQVQRAMVSIQSENRRRQRIFAEYGVNNINGYSALYKSGDAAEPVPHLFIIIDEFAELKREEADFMKELVSVAQVGRSLGVHLILSTQRPSGTVDENIWANSKFRLCLRVQDRQDSMDMLHRPEAAYLTQAGRCYLQVGNDEIFELFQSGWSGADYDEELSGAGLQIAQLLSATGKVDINGNHARLKRKDEQKRRWIMRLIGILIDTEKEIGKKVTDSDFHFEDNLEFKSSFYEKVRMAQPDFEENQFNTVRISDFCELYQRLVGTVDGEKLPEEILRTAAREGRRLPEMKMKSQLEATVDYLSGIAKKVGVPEIRKLWLPVLPEYLFLDEMDAFNRTAFRDGVWPRQHLQKFQLSAVIGMADDPANQTQMPVGIDFADGGHHLLLGTVSTGKSTFLQSAIFSLASTYTPDMLNIYCLDFSAKMLAVFSDLKHVGGYMDETDLETDRISKFFTMISRMLDERKKRFSGTSYADYINHSGWVVPAILIVIDNFGSFHEKTGEAFDTIMSRIAKEGIGYGIFLLVSAGSIGIQEIPSRLAESFRTGIALEMTDQFAYSDILHVVKPPVFPESRVKGRGLMYYGERILEFQTALAAHAEGSPERNDLIKEAVERMNNAWTGVPAHAIPTIPERPKRNDFTSLPEYTDALKDPRLMPVGYDFEYASVWSFDLVKNFVFLITGTRQSGKSVCMENLMETALERGDEVIMLEYGGSRFATFAVRESVRYGSDTKSIMECMTYIHDQLVSRSAVKKSCIEKHSSKEEMFHAALVSNRISLFIGNLYELEKEMYDVKSELAGARSLFETLCERGNGYNLFLFAEIGDKEQANLMGYTSFESMRNYRSGIRFGGRINEQKIFSFENVGYQEQDRTQKTGLGFIPSDNREARLEKVVIPLM